ncbi:NF-X1-type zinc finger protein NFXL2 [Selaginella moellendorffii]|uniref:NF-X1-type zinc finger protein NFXL2 n=1 Tax=Selaginella moellendorffii TaxID=88036 RepID=UPI000D1C95D0|nr:NF-X1-type zinc finger protein NFXL2 [Selaginella moellendorffii]|eukprot:XP_002987702.2 NF-X1-type zinc finger protein NFXL2 [Selaginella moellendorffii]
MQRAWDKPLLPNPARLEELHPSIKNQLEVSSSDDEERDYSSSGDDDPGASIFRNYPGVAATDNDPGQLFQAGVNRINSLVAATKGGASTCLICLEKIRKIDPIWHCKQGCFAVLHLVCIQSWARQVLSTSENSSAGRNSSSRTSPARWHCPKCRRDYPQAEIPREYRCYCGKEVDPRSDPWLTPHSCGERCELELGLCSHTCLLLCHPGPCPPCPQLVQLACHCGKLAELRRCGHKSFSCQRLCSKRLGCGVHSCDEICHEGECKPCTKFGVHRCRCGSVTEVRPCSQADFQCERICDKELSCKKHVCGKQCHAGACGECELQGRRTCACGKEAYKDLACDVKVPTCGSTCEKLLACGLHRCPERCHAGSCVGTCRVLINKRCRCGSTVKEVPCYQDLVCERKCQHIRNCQRHACRRRCCDGDCPPCSEICGKKLRCGNHKCPAPCHRGLCAPCPLTVKISCQCGFTTLEVPCGADKDVKPPKCSKRCQRPHICGHGDLCKPHRCHYGPCPPCQLLCNKKLDCGHSCNQRCHGPRLTCPVLKGTKKERKAVISPIPGSPCPPCSVLVSRPCMGKHPAGSKMVPCNDESRFSCEKPCGNLLSCGNHFCRDLCHVVTISRALSNGTVVASGGAQQYDSCSSCRLKCTKTRDPPCPHPCEIGCHTGKCPACKVSLKKSCHCGTLVRTLECSAFGCLSEDERIELLSCKGPCHRKLENCSHLCSEICHPGSCPSLCSKKVTVRCACQRIRKAYQCFEVQAAREKQSALVPCDQDCLKAKASQELEEDLQHKQAADKELRRDDLKKVLPKQRKARALRSAHGDWKYKESLQMAMRYALVVALVLGSVAMAYYGAKALRSLSDWMDEIDNQRPRAKLH